MHVLVVEDDDNKRLQLGNLLARLPNIKISNARSLQSGLRAVRNEDFDLIVLDMTLPNFDAGPDEAGGLTHPFGGREFLSQMDRFDRIIPVIVVTQFETFGRPPHVLKLADLGEDLARSYPETYRGMVYYHAAVEGWQSELESLISKTIRGLNENSRH